MNELHPNVAVVQKFNPADLSTVADAMANDVVFHYVNPELPELQGDYVGVDGVRVFFDKLGQETSGSLQVTPISVTPVGDELLVMQTRNSMAFPERSVEVDVVLVWRIVDGKIAEVWDIPSIHTAKVSTIEHQSNP